ncbi:MAG: TIGR04157 family glycosyltransferase [Tannerella sp.]|jgi:glycosyltransferase|nr:TIGR04157 family glycosyltransferase [Tannerella sp.]
MKRKIYLFSQTSMAANYGIGTYIEQIIHLIENAGMEPTLVEICSRGGKKTETVCENGINIIRLPYNPEISSLQTEKYDDRYNRNVAYLLKEYIPDDQTNIFHLNYLTSEYQATWLKRVFNGKIILTVHYMEWGMSLLGNVTRLRKIMTGDETLLNDADEKNSYESFRKEKSLFETVDLVICLSEHTAGLLKQDYRIDENQLSVVYNGLADVAGERADRIQLRKKYRLPNHAPVILFAGRLDAVKGLSYFIEAVKMLLYKLPTCHILIAGSGDCNTYLKACGNRWMNVHFTGLLDKKDLYELYAIADIGVMPSFHEQCSYVAIEMMMHGLPIIGSTSTGLKEMIADGETGLHIPVIEYEDRVDIDTDLLAEKMLYLLQDPKERKRMGRNARKRYEALYTAGRMGRQMLALYQSLWDDEAP